MRPAAPGRAGGPREAAGALLAIALFQAVLFAPVWISGHVLMPARLDRAPPFLRAGAPVAEDQDWAGTDKVVFNYPNVVRYVRALRESPRDLLWNPDNFCGIPFLATQNTHVLYPLNGLFLLVPPLEGMLLSAGVHGLIAGFLAYLFARSMFSRSAALLAGAVYSGTGWFLAHHDLIQYVQSAAWVPLMLIGARRAVAAPGFAGVALLAAGVALSFLGGMPQITVLGLLAAGYASLAIAWTGAGAGRMRGLSAAGAGVVAGLLLSAPQLLPTLEIQGGSGRSRIPLEEMKTLGMRPPELATALWPEALGNPPLLARLGTSEAEFGPARAAGVDGLGSTLTERIFYPGLLGVLLAILALVFRPADRRVLAGAALGAVALLALFGTPVLDLLYHLPGFQFANHRRIVFLLVLALAWLAAAGAEVLLRGAKPARISLALLAGAVLLPSAAAALGWNLPFDALPGEARSPAGAVQGVFRTAGLHAAIAGAPILLACFAPLRVLPWLLLPCLLVDMTPLHRRLSPGQQPEGFETRSEAVEFLRSERGDPLAPPAPDGANLGRIVRYQNPATALPGTEGDLPPLPPNLNLLFQIRDVHGYEAIVDRRREEIMEIVEPGISVAHHLLREFRRPESLRSPLLDLMGARYILTNTPELPGFERVFASLQERIAIFRRPSALPPLTVPEEIRVAPDDPAVLAALGRPEYRPGRECWILPEDAKRLGLPDAPGVAFETGGTPASLELAGYGATRVDIDYSADGPVPLRIADSYHPGWTLRGPGGETLPLVRADHGFRLAMLPAGSGRLSMTFEPVSFIRGIQAAALGAAMLAAAGVLALRRRRSPSIPDSADA